MRDLNFNLEPTGCALAEVADAAIRCITSVAAGHSLKFMRPASERQAAPIGFRPCGTCLRAVGHFAAPRGSRLRPSDAVLGQLPISPGRRST